MSTRDGQGGFTSHWYALSWDGAGAPIARALMSEEEAAAHNAVSKAIVKWCNGSCYQWAREQEE